MRRTRAPLCALVLVCLLATPGGVAGTAVAAPPAPTQLEPVLQTTVDTLGVVPHAVTISRVVFTPGASDPNESLPALRLIVVESGTLTFHAEGVVEITHAVPKAGETSTAAAARAPSPTPTPAVSPTTDQLLGPGDGAPVPLWTMHSLRNNTAKAAVILDVRIMTGAASAPPANLDVEPLASDASASTLPASRALVTLGRGTMAAGGIVAAPASGTYQLVARGHGAERLDLAADRSVRNAGSEPLDVYVLSVAPAVATVPQQPTQPATGPGGAEAAFDQVVATQHGTNPGGYWLFEPAAPHAGGPAPTAPLPIVVFLGGCCGDDGNGGFVEPYRAWIDHFVRRGAVVILPVFHDSTAVDDTVTAVRAALAELKHGAHPATDPARLAAVGHSFGSALAVQYAAVADAKGLPVPEALMLTTPGCDGCDLGHLSAIPATTRVLILVGSQDDMAGEGDAKIIWAGLKAIPADRKSYVRLMGDDHGSPPLVANHPLTATSDWGPLDALDWYGTWKLADALMSCSFAGQDCDVAFGNTPAQRFMGLWSDGVPVAEAQVTEDPGPPAATPSS